METKQVTLFSPNGVFMENRSINEENFMVMVAYFGLRLCNGHAILLDNIIYTPIKLPYFLAAMQRLNDIDGLYEYFFPYLVYIQQAQISRLTEFLESNKKLQKAIENSMNISEF